MPKLTQTQLEEIRKRAEQATPGPWRFVDPGKNTAYDTDMGYIESARYAEDLVCSFGDCKTFHPIEGTPFNDNDAGFVVNARQDIPNLLAHIHFLVDEIDKRDEKNAELEAEVAYRRMEENHWKKKSEDYREKGKRLFEERNMWKELRLEAGGRIGMLVPRIAALETAIADALSIAEMQKENFDMEPWASLEEALNNGEE
jgi:hypothetical protein